MNKPYIVCHMMTSVDGRIDCAMTEHLPGVQEYYDTLDALDAPTRISGRVTAELEMALPGKFEAKTAEALGKEAFSKAADAEGEVYCDRTRANRFDIHFCRVAQPHQRAFAELLIDHAEGGFKRFVVLCDLLCGNFLFCHGLYYRRIYFLIRVFLYSGGVRVSTKLFFAEIFISPRGDLPNMLDGKMRR